MRINRSLDSRPVGRYRPRGAARDPSPGSERASCVMGIATFSGTKPEPRPGSTLQALQRRELAMKLMTATKRADPMIDQRMGKLLPPTLTVKSSGKPSRRASHSPTRAPMKPKAMETRQPPRDTPVMA